MDGSKQAALLGWREWVALPALGLEHIKAKVDTGARTSALHTFELEPFQQGGAPMVRFKVHPWQQQPDLVVDCQSAVVDRRPVTDSGGHTETRYVIETILQLGPHRWTVEVTLTNRDNMRFRMLLGRTAMAGRFVVDPAASYLLGQQPVRQ